MTQHERKRATEQREGEAEEQREPRDLLQLRDLQIFDVGDDEEWGEDDAVDRVRALGHGEARAGGEQLHERQRGRGEDEDGQRFERRGLLEL